MPTQTGRLCVAHSACLFAARPQKKQSAWARTLGSYACVTAWSSALGASLCGASLTTTTTKTTTTTTTTTTATTTTAAGGWFRRSLESPHEQ